MFHRASVLIPIISVIVMWSYTGCGDTEKELNQVETHIREILELPTYEHVYRDIVYVGEESKFLLFTTVDKRLLFSVDIVVRAGIDLKEGFSVDPGDNGLITVSLPPPKILMVDADENSINQYFIKEKGGSIPRLTYYDEIDRKKEEIRGDALARNILLKAESNAKQLISNILHLAGFTSVVFKEFKEIKPAPQNQTEEE